MRQNVPIAESYARKLVTAPTSGVSSGRSEPPLSKGVDTLPRLRHDPDVGFRRLPALRILLPGSGRCGYAPSFSNHRCSGIHDATVI